VNHVYRLVWNASQQAYCAVTETAKGTGKSGGKSATTAAPTLRTFASLLIASCAISAGATATNTLPTGGQVTAGTAAISSTANTLTVNQGSQRAAINWQSFNIGSGATVNFVQPNASAVVLNRVVGNEQSVIAGAMNANGQVFLLNSSGVLFTGTARVDVGGLVASTLNLSDTDFMAGRSTFTANGGRGSVINLGTINAADGGYVALLGNQVKNEGVITARLGTAVMAAGDQVSLNFNGDSLVGVTIDQGTLNALVENKHAIRADGGLVVLTAKGLDAVMATVVNNTGEVRAQTIQNREGKIYLLGGMESDRIEVGGTLDASAPNGGNGGFVETSAANVRVVQGTRVSTQAPQGKGGQWLIDPNDYTIAATGGDIDGATLANNLLTTDVTITSAQGGTAGNGDIFVNDAVNMGASSARHSLTLKAYRDIVFPDKDINNPHDAGIDATTNTNTQPLDVVLWANNGGAGGSIKFGLDSFLKTNGGKIWMGGGTGTATWNGLTVGDGYATGRTGSPNGIAMAGGATVDSLGGLVRVKANADVVGNRAFSQSFDGVYGDSHLRATGGIEVYAQTGDIQFENGEVQIGSSSGATPTTTSIVDVGAGNNFGVKLSGGGNASVLGTLQIVSAKDVYILSVGGGNGIVPGLLVIAASTVSGRMTVRSHGDISVTGALNVTGRLNLDTAYNTGVAPWGAISQTAPITVGERTFLTGSSISLTNPSNRFGANISITTKAGDASIVDSGDLTLIGVTTTGSFLGIAGTGKNVVQLGNITTGTGAVLVADSANGGVYSNSFRSISTGSGRYLIYSHDPVATTLPATGFTPAFTRFGDTYSSYPPGSVTETGNGIIYVGTTAYVPPSNNSTNTSTNTTNTTNAVASAISTPQTVQPPSTGLPGSFLPSGSVPSGNGQPTAFVNVVNPPPSVIATFGPGERFAVISYPSAGEPTQAVTLSQARDMMQGGGNAEGADRVVRVPVSRNSLEQIVNGGLNLPNGVEQELFVVQSD